MSDSAKMMYQNHPTLILSYDFESRTANAYEQDNTSPAGLTEISDETLEDPFYQDVLYMKTFMQVRTRTPVTDKTVYSLEMMIQYQMSKYLDTACKNYEPTMFIAKNFFTSLPNNIFSTRESHKKFLTGKRIKETHSVYAQDEDIIIPLLVKADNTQSAHTRIMVFKETKDSLERLMTLIGSHEKPVHVQESSFIEK
jgi:hypothetical protein